MAQDSSAKSSQKGDYAFTKRCLGYADTNNRIALHLLAVYERVEAEVAGHILHAWYGIALAAGQGEILPFANTADWLSKVAEQDLPQPVEFSLKDWKKDLSSIAGDELLQLQLSGKPLPLSPRRLRQHCEYLSTVIRHYLRRLDKDFGVVPFGKSLLLHWRKWAPALLLLLIAIWIYTSFEDGKPWRVAYYGGTNLSGKPLRVTNEAVVDFDWLRSDVPSNVPDDNFSMRWDSCLKLDKAENLSFDLASDDGSRLSIDGKMLIDSWEPQAFVSHLVRVSLKPGVHHIRIDYFEEAGNAALRLQAGKTRDLSTGFLNKWLFAPAIGEAGRPVCLKDN